MSGIFRIFIGYDPHETISYNALCHSIWSRASRPVAITPLRKQQIDGWSGDHELATTDFSFSRFLVPFLCNFQGEALFMDCDMLCLEDICRLRDEVDPNMAATVVKHDYVPGTRSKFLGQVQSKYPPLDNGETRKNWSSVMHFNCAHPACRRLTPDYVDASAPGRGLDLHQFKWCADNEIGSLGREWNYLVDEENQADPNSVKIVHWTLGGPFFEETADAEFADKFWREVEKMNSNMDSAGRRGYRHIERQPGRWRDPG